MQLINKALFKQSAKANWMRWTVVTVATCVMLAIVIIVLGNLGINDIRDSLKNVFTEANQDSQLKEESIDAYDSYFTIMENYDGLYGMLGIDFNGTVGSKIENTCTQFDAYYQDFVTQNGREPNETERQTLIDNAVQSFIDSFGVSEDLIEAFLPGMANGMTLDELKTILAGIIDYYDTEYVEPDEEEQTEYPIIDNYFAKQIYNEAYAQEIAEEGATEEYALSRAESAQIMAIDIVKQYQGDVANAGGTYDYVSDNYLTIATTYVNNTMYQNVYDIFIEEGQTENDARISAVAVKVISNSAITTYQMLLTDEDFALTVDTTVTTIPEAARAEACESITDQIPEQVAAALTELGDMDIYGLIIGSIFYRIAGLLLPMVFVIMTANSLLAGQVDSGSMAYVLSTPTKRRTVSVTQMTYLLFSLFVMYAILTVVSLLSVWVVGGNAFAINYGEIALFNLGAFLTMFAFAGFCFMCSAIFNRSKHSLSIGGGLTIFMLVCTILGLFGSNVVPSAMRIDAMNFFNYLSIITFFDTVSILDGGLSFLWKFGVLLAIGIVCIIIGIFRFDKKDLPL